MVKHAHLHSAIRSLEYARNYTRGHEESASINRAIQILRETIASYGDLMDAVEAGYVSAAYDLLDRQIDLRHTPQPLTA